MWLLSSAGERKNVFYIYVSTAKFGIKNIYTFMDKVIIEVGHICIES